MAYDYSNAELCVRFIASKSPDDATMRDSTINISVFECSTSRRNKRTVSEIHALRDPHVAKLPYCMDDKTVGGGGRGLSPSDSLAKR